MKALTAATCGLLVGVVGSAGLGAAVADTPADPGTGRAESCVLDSNSGCTQPHGFGVKPSSITAVNGGSSIVSIDPNATTATNYRINFVRHDGTRYAAGTNARFYVHYDFGAVPTPTPTASPTPTPTATASPVRTCTSPSFTTSQSNSGWSNGGYYVHNNMWNNDSGGTQTLRACAYNNWEVTATQPNTTSVKTYPNVHKDYPNTPLSSFQSLTSTFAASTPHVGIYNVAYDIWLNGVATSGSTEVMIWTENYNQRPAGSVQATVVFGGKTYDVWRSGSNYIAFVSRTVQLYGSMDLLAMFNWLKTRGWLSQTSTVGQIDYGIEICSTNGAPATFKVTDFSIRQS